MANPKSSDPAGSDARHMAGALQLARRGLGQTWPNPTVGCVLVKEGHIIARGWTQPGGRPHGEAEALRRAAARAPDLARGSTAYVTLEPCAHTGKTSPCADALIEAGISRAVVAMEDPDPRVAGRGNDKLRAAGIPVLLGVGADAASAINAGFFMRITEGRPWVSLKVATSLDGRIATHGGQSKWITGEAARARGHLLRAQHDAVLVGAGTATADDPALTVRLPGLSGRSPVRVVLDSRLRLPLTHELVRTAGAVPTWLVCLAGGDGTRRRAFEQAGVVLIEVPGGDDKRPEPDAVLAALAARGITRVFVEGGGDVAASLLRARLVDRLYWFRAPMVIGGDGIAATAPFGVDTLDLAAMFKMRKSEQLGHDTLDVLDRAP